MEKSLVVIVGWTECISVVVADQTTVVLALFEH